METFRGQPLTAVETQTTHLILAEELIRLAGNGESDDPDNLYRLALAQVHATLATVSVDAIMLARKIMVNRQMVQDIVEAHVSELLRDV